MFGDRDRSRNELPDELKDLGLSAADIKRAVQDKKALEDRLTVRDAEFEGLRTSSEATTNSLTEMRNRMAEIEANDTLRQQRQDEGEPKSTSFLDNEDAAFNERFTKGVAPVAMAAVQANAKVAKMIAMQSLVGKVIKTSQGNLSLTALWNRWSAEIDKAAKQMPPVQLANENSWLNIFDYVKGQHMEELMSKPDTFIESGSTNVDMKIGDDKQPDKGTDEEAKIASRMKIPLEKYLEQKKKMKFGPVIST